MHGRHKRGGPDAAQNGRCGEGKGQAAHGKAGRSRQTQHQENAGGADKGHGGNADGHDAVKLLNDGVQLAGQRNGNIVGIVKAAGIGNDRNGRLHIGSDINAAGIQVGKQSVIGGGLDAVAAVSPSYSRVTALSMSAVIWSREMAEVITSAEKPEEAP